MKNSKLVVTLKQLSGLQFRRFGDYVHSPFFNKHQPTIQFYELLAERWPEMEGFKKEEVFKSIYGTVPFMEHKITLLMSGLMGLLESFLGQLVWERDQREQNLLRLCDSFERNQGKLFQNQQRRLEKQFKKSGIKDARYYYHLSRYYELLDAFNIQKGSRKQQEFIQQHANAFDIYFISEKLKQSCDMLSRMNVVNREYDLKLVEEILQHIRDNWIYYSEIPPIMVYYRIFMTLWESEEEEHYLALKKLLAQFNKSFTTEEAQSLYDYAQNYCIKKINQGKSDYLQEIFSLYQQLIHTNLILKNGLISEWDYKNIITVGCRLQAFSWTKGFIKDYRKFLADHCQENAFTYNLSAFYYANSKYEQALLLLQQLEFTDVYYHLGAKFIQCKIYYELEETEPLFSLLDTFRIYLLRNKDMAKKQRMAPLNFVRVTKKLATLRDRKKLIDQKTLNLKLEALKNRLLQTDSITNLDWLLKQMEAFKKTLQVEER